MVLNISLQLKPTSAEKVGLCAILETIEGCGELDPSTIKQTIALENAVTRLLLFVILCFCSRFLLLFVLEETHAAYIVN